MNHHINNEESREITARSTSHVREWLGRYVSQRCEAPRMEIALLCTLVEALLAHAPVAEPVAPGYTSREIIEACDAAGIDDRAFRRLMSALKVADMQALDYSATDHEVEMDQALAERDEREEVINAILDEVLGLDRHEWSSAYGFADAIEEVKARMYAIEQEHSGLESEIEDLKIVAWPDWANQVLKIVRSASGYDGYDDSDGIDIPGEVQELADEYSTTFAAMETYRKERDEARAALKADEPVAPRTVDLRKIAEKTGIRMDLWDMGAASLAYSEGCEGVTRSDLERFAAAYGFACWNAALEANPANAQSMVDRALGSLFTATTPALSQGDQP